MRSIFIFSAFILFYCNECASTKNVILIYDKVETTTYDMDQLTTSVKNIATGLFSNDRLDMRFKIVFPYKSYMVEIEGSPQAKPQSNHYRIRNPSTLKSLLTQLRESSPRSVIFVITNITTLSDVTQMHDILEYIQIRRTEVNFIIEKKDSFQGNSLQHYLSITSISNGLIHSSSIQFNQISDSLRHWLKSLPHKVNQIPIHHSDSGEYCITLDSLLRDTTLYIGSSLDDCEYEMQLKKPYMELQLTFQEDGVHLERIYASKPCFMIRKNLKNLDYLSFYNFRVFGQSRFDIDYGFSKDPVSSLEETRTRPIKGTFNRLYVTSTSSNFQATFDYFRIRFLNGTYFQNKIPLYHVPETNLFDGPFEPPNKEYFFIEVTGHVNGEAVTRMSSTAMNAADQIENNPINSELNDNTDMSYLNLKMIFLLIAFSSLAAVLLCQFFRYIECFTKTPETPAELQISHRKAVPNFYQPVVAYKAPK
ncbi:hemicentin-1-like [Planococcus citri]|uniref:hemicentin-1-like n=1 Tax=Planococcus citri TaxID=170843 RepID=UPI0031F758DC